MCMCGKNIMDFRNISKTNNKDKECYKEKETHKHIRENTKDLHSLAFGLGLRAMTMRKFTNKPREY